MSTILLVAIAVILSSFTSSNTMIILIASMIAIALYLTWRSEWYRVQGLQRAWRKARDRTKDQILQHLLIKPTTRRVAGRSPAIGFIFLFVAGLKANCCRFYSLEKLRNADFYKLSLFTFR